MPLQITTESFKQIADYAGQSAQLGWITFLGFLALVSVSLGVLNLLPIPLLDGGHLVYYFAEIVKGSPVSEKTMEIGQRFGMALAQDISDRTIQNSESQWARAKSFDTFTPLGPYVETKIDPHDLTIQLFQNGQLRQNSNTNQLIFNCFQLVSFISTNMTLLPGDIIITGTPSGIGPIQSGDRLEVRIQGMAPLVNTVK